MLVSARLLIGPGRLRGPQAVAVGRRQQWPASQARRISTSTSPSRGLDATFFARSFDHSAVRSPSLPTRRPQLQLPILRGILARRKQQKHIAAAAAPGYAPASDDPAIASLGRTSSGSFQDDFPSGEPPARPTLTPTQALAAGYRPVEPLSTASLPRLYRQLAKAQLTFLVTLTGMAGYALCPSALAVSTSVTTLLLMTGGTALCSASANAVNQLVEAPYDAQMPRTRNRPLPSRSLTPLHAATFATTTGMLGVGALAAINPLTAVLGMANIVLYAGVYTPTKRVTIANTWVGSIVGAIPPLIGWTACTGTLHLATDTPGWALAALMFAWQFPHFNSLAHTLRREYARGGYRMMSVTNPALNRRTSLRYAVSLLPICSVLLPWTGVVHWVYGVLSAPINAALVWASYGFWRHNGDKPARLCFWVSLVHLPAVLLLAMACKTDVIKSFKRRFGWLPPVESDDADVTAAASPRAA